MKLITCAVIFYVAGLILFWLLPADKRDLYADAYYLWSSIKDFLFLLYIKRVCESGFICGMVVFCLGWAGMRIAFEFLNAIGVVPTVGWDGVTVPISLFQMSVATALFVLYFKREGLWKSR